MNAKADIRRIFTEKIEKHLYKYYWQQLGLKDWQRRVKDRINEVPRNERILKTLESFIGSLRGKRVLIVGSGWGGACVAAKNLGAEEVVGIDIDDEVNETANLRMRLAGYEACCLHGVTEDIPFVENYFDYVHCFTVLEHVNDVRKSLPEMVRVTKGGGYIFIQAPSYLRPMERHYKIPYIPLMPKKLAKIYLKLLKRPLDFIDSINYIWPGKIKKMLSGIENIKVEQIASEYRYRFDSFMNYGKDYSSSTVKPETIQRRNIKKILGKVVGKLVTTFYKTWDLVFGTQEIYFLIRKL